MARTSSRTTTIILVLLVVFCVAPAAAQSLGGSRASLDIQNRMAREHDFSYLSTPTEVRRFVRSGLLVPVAGNEDFDLHAVSFPYARPEALLFIERLASQYRGACGEKLVVTSLTRPQNMQPRNASSRSVHPTGMAIDLRRSANARCRGWLERVLVSLEGQRVVEATRENYPPHYHVVVFPKPYVRYVQARTDGDVQLETRVAEMDVVKYRVRSGDSLWNIARRHGTTVERLRTENQLRGNRIYAGQLIEVPVSR